MKKNRPERNELDPKHKVFYPQTKMQLTQNWLSVLLFKTENVPGRHNLCS